MLRIRTVALLAAVVVLLAACGDDDDTSTAATNPGVSGSITVFGASSLTAAFTEIGKAFTAEHPGAKVAFSFDASSTLVQQIVQGAPADVFASADTANMDKLTKAGRNDGPPVVFATNRLEIITAPGNQKGITALADLAKPGLKVVLCAAEVPCGRYAKQSLDAAKVALTPVSFEQNVKGVVTKVTTGEADAGIVYATDVQAAGANASGVEIPKDVNVVSTYPIALVRDSKQPTVGKAFVDFLTGSAGQAILARYGFGSP